MGAMVYMGAVRVREWGERKKLAPVVSLGKLATMFVARVVRVGGRKNR